MQRTGSALDSSRARHCACSRELSRAPGRCVWDRALLSTSVSVLRLRCIYLWNPVWTSCFYLPVLRWLRISICKELALSLSRRRSWSQHLLPRLLAQLPLLLQREQKRIFAIRRALLLFPQPLPKSVLSRLFPWYVLVLVLAWWVGAGDEVIVSRFGAHAELSGGCW